MVVAVWIGGLGCGRGEVEPPPDILAPLEDNRAPPPSPVDGDPFPEVLSVVSGGDSDLWWAHAVGYVKGSSDAVWTAAQDPNVGVDRREVDEWTVDPVSDAFDASYIVHNTVHDVITVNYDLRWLHQVQEGDASDPELVVVVWEKTVGTGFIDILEGSLVIRPVTPEVSELQFVEHLNASLRDDQVLVSYLRDFHASLAAVVRGDPLPTY